MSLFQLGRAEKVAERLLAKETKAVAKSLQSKAVNLQADHGQALQMNRMRDVLQDPTTANFWEKTQMNAGKAIETASYGVKATASGTVTATKWTLLTPLKVVGKVLAAPFKLGKRALTSENKMIKYPAVATAGLAVAGTGAAVMAGSGRNSSQLPPEMLETQAQLDQNQQVLDGMMQPAMAPMQDNPYNQAQPVIGGQMAYDGPVATNEQAIAQG